MRKRVRAMNFVKKVVAFFQAVATATPNPLWFYHSNMAQSWEPSQMIFKVHVVGTSVLCRRSKRFWHLSWMKVWGGAINAPYYIYSLQKLPSLKHGPSKKHVIPKGKACRPSINVQIVSGSTNINTHVTVHLHVNRKMSKNHAGWWFQPVWKILVKLDHFPR